MSPCPATRLAPARPGRRRLRTLELDAVARCHAEPGAPSTGPPSPWRRAFVSASCRMRYTASCTAAGGLDRRRGIDVDAQLDARRAHLRRRAPRGRRASAAARGPRLWRSCVSSSRTSASAARAVVEIVSSACASRRPDLRRRVPRAVGLGDHDRERVRDDVVHVAGDPHALLLGGGLDLGALLRLAVRAARGRPCARARRPSRRAAARTPPRRARRPRAGSVLSETPPPAKVGPRNR